MEWGGQREGNEMAEEEEEEKKVMEYNCVAGSFSGYTKKARDAGLSEKAGNTSYRCIQMASCCRQTAEHHTFFQTKR